MTCDLRNVNKLIGVKGFGKYTLIIYLRSASIAVYKQGKSKSIYSKKQNQNNLSYLKRFWSIEITLSVCLNICVYNFLKD